MLLPVLAAAAFFCLTAALAPPGACASSSDCSLNGDCVSGSCVCDVGWSGSPACDVLRLAPSAPMSGYRNTSGASWGGRPVYDAGLWHLLVAQMRNNCSLWTWKNNSAIVHATSTTPDGPYQYVDEIVPPFAHNPKLYKVPVWDGGGFVLASIGGGLWRPEPQICSQPWADGDAPGQWRHARVRAAATPAPNEGGGDPASPTEDGCGPEPPLNGGCGITLSWAATMAGPWSAPAPLIIVDQNRSALLDCAHTNPSLAWRRNARGVRMGFNAGYCHDGLETIGVAQAQSWRGPWTLATPDPVLFDSPGVPHHCEDPVIWESDRGWHMIVHNQDSTGRVALYAHSLDGVSNWTLHSEAGNPGPYEKRVNYTDGTYAVTDIQRPEFIYDEVAGRNAFLINGAFLGSTGQYSSFTLVRPIAQ